MAAYTEATVTGRNQRVAIFRGNRQPAGATQRLMTNIMRTLILRFAFFHHLCH